MQITSQTMVVEYDNPAEFGQHYGKVTPCGWILTNVNVLQENGNIVGFKALYEMDIPKPKSISLSDVKNNKVNLCDTCKYSVADCLADPDDVMFGDGIGNDNICCCAKYEPHYDI